MNEVVVIAHDLHSLFLVFLDFLFLLFFEFVLIQFLQSCRSVYLLVRRFLITLVHIALGLLLFIGI